MDGDERKQEPAPISRRIHIMKWINCPISTAGL